MFDGRFRSSVDRGVGPIGSALGRTGLSPDHLTALGLVVAVPAAFAIGTGRLVLGLLLLIASAVPDLLGRCAGQGQRHGVQTRAHFSTRCRPGHRCPHPGRCGVVPPDVPARARGNAAVRDSRGVDAHLLRAGQGGVAWFHGQGRPDGAGRADHPVVHRSGCARDPGADPVGHAGADLGHRGPALRQGMAPGDHRAPSVAGQSTVVGADSAAGDQPPRAAASEPTSVPRPGLRAGRLRRSQAGFA